MSFAKDLEHIKNELSNPIRGYRDGFTLVRARSLSNLLHRFELLEREIREIHTRTGEHIGETGKEAQ